MIKMYTKEMVLIDDIDRIVGSDVSISKSINGIYNLKFNAYNTDIIYNEIKNKNIIEIESDLYVIDSIKTIRKVVPHLEITAYHISSELDTMYWENDFEVFNPKLWTTNTRIVSGLFYEYLGSFYYCLESHVSTETFDETKFLDVSTAESNFMPDTTPQEVLEKLLNGTNWTVGLCDTFTSTDFTLQRGKIYDNIKNVVNQWGGELEVIGRTIALKQRIGNDTLEEFKYASNNIETTVDIDSSRVINKLFVFGQNDITFESIYPTAYVEDLASNAMWGERVGEITFGDIEDVDFLLERGIQELNKMKNPSVSISSKVLKLDSQNFNIGDTVLLIDEDMGQINAQYRIVSITYNPTENKVYGANLGSTELNIANIFKATKKDIDSGDDALNDRIDNLPNDANFIARVIDVVQEQTVSAETAHIQNAWITNLFVERMETNQWGRDIRNPDLQALIDLGEQVTTRNYIVAENQTLNFMSELIDLLQTETLKIENPDKVAGGLVTVYYTAIAPDTQQYKFYTITPPHILNPQIPIEQDYLYEVKVFKVKELAGIKQSFSKMNFTFEEDGSEVEMYVGAGDGLTELSNKMKIRKGFNDVQMYYYDSSGSDVPNGFLFKQTHVEVKNSNVPIGGGHLSNIWYGTVDPSASFGQDGDIYFKYV